MSENSSGKPLGIEYREWLIGMAMQGILSSGKEKSTTAEKCADAAIQYADAVISRLDGSEPKKRRGTFS